jgi:hypothetical protein
MSAIVFPTGDCVVYCAMNADGTPICPGEGATTRPRQHERDAFRTEGYNTSYCTKHYRHIREMEARGEPRRWVTFYKGLAKNFALAVETALIFHLRDNLHYELKNGLVRWRCCEDDHLKTADTDIQRNRDWRSAKWLIPPVERLPRPVSYEAADAYRRMAKPHETFFKRPDGRFDLWLYPPRRARLEIAWRPFESYSDTILRLASTRCARLSRI